MPHSAKAIRSARRQRLRLEMLERRELLAANVVISEFMASNVDTLLDGKGVASDWIELYNAGDEAADLEGWHLTDDPEEPALWTFPAGAAPMLAPGDHLVVFASGDGVPDPLGNLHTNFRLAASGDYVALVKPDLAVQSEFGSAGSHYPPQRADISYGTDFGVVAGDAARYFTTATPGTANGDGIIGFVEDTQFSVDRGYYTDFFDVVVSSATPGATLVYTTDGSQPDLSNGTQVFLGAGTAPSATVSISTTTTLRAAAFRSDFEPTNVDTQTYLFVADVVSQPNNPPGFPTTWNDAPAADYEMDPEITGDPLVFQDLLEGLRDLPAISIASDVDGFFGASGIYTNPQNDTLEIPVSAEYILPDGTTGFQIDAGLKVAGGASRRPTNSPKHSLSLRFRAQYGDSRLNHELFEGSPVDSFNSLQLRAVYNNSWIHWDQGQRSRGTLIRDQFVRDSLIEAGQDDAGRGHYAHLYLNGLYWGVYNLHERADSSHFAEHNGGDSDDYDALNGGSPVDGTIDSWNQLKTIAAGGNWAAIQAALDVDNFIDWVLANAYGGNADLKTNGNWRAAGGGPDNAPWRMYAWDSERILEGVTSRPPNNITDATGFLDDLMNVPEFVVRFADRIQTHFFYDGTFTPDAVTERWLRRVAELETAIVAESARWGDYRRDVHPRGATPLLYTRDGTWIPETNRVVNEFFPGRTQFVVDQYRSLGIFPDTAAPDYLIDGTPSRGGVVTPGATLRLSSDEVIYYTTDGSDPRLEGGGISPSAIAYDPATIDNVLLPPGSDWSYNDTGADLGEAWRQPGFDDSGWSSGPAELGFGEGDEATVVSFGANPSDKHRTTYFRRQISVSETGFTTAKLRVRRDDGVAVYLNGEEIARDNLPGGTITADTFALAAAADDGNNWHEFSFDPSLLQLGTNTLAVEVHQNSPASSDLSFDLELIAVEQTSPGISLNETLEIRGRSRTATGEWSAVQNALFRVPNEPASATNVRVTEIHYHPAVDGDAEFIELQNITADTVVDLDNVLITDGPSDPLTIPLNTPLLPGQFGLIVQNMDAFTAAYPSVDPSRILGTYSGKLSNGGERLRILDASGDEIADINYGDSDPWPKPADGFGSSLVLNDPLTIAAEQTGKPYHYRPSIELGGSPAAPAREASPVIISEVLSHTDAPLTDSIELHNLSAEPIDIGGWLLSDDGAEPGKYRIPVGTVLAGNGFLVLDEVNFNPPFPTTDSLIPFALSGAQGDQVWLFEADAGIPTGLIDQVHFGATFNGESLGRIDGSNGRLVRLANRSLGALNGTFKRSEVVVSEINYHPADPTPEALAIEPILTERDLEFVEVHNFGSESASLADWRLRGEVDFDFAPAHVLPPKTSLVLVTFDPADAANANRAAAFRAQYGLSPSVDLVGPLSGTLNNSHGLIKLQQPDAAPPDDPLFTPQVTADEVIYGDLAPWPTSPDGQGASLQRVGPGALGLHAASWSASLPSPGNVPTAPTIESVVVNGGDPSRSEVTELAIRFDQEVLVDDFAFLLRQRETNSVVDNLSVQHQVVDGKTVSTIRFGEDPLVVSRGGQNSLSDGNYSLRVFASLVTAVDSDLTMPQDHWFGEEATDTFFRYFGDTDGDRDVDGVDYGHFGSTFLRSHPAPGYRSDLDFDGDGDVDGTDYARFSEHFLRSLSFE